MKSLRRFVSWAALVLLLGVVVWVLRPQPVPVDVAQVAMRPFAVTIEEQGRTRARNPYTVAAPINGRLLRTSLDEGDRVTAGQVVAQLALPPQDQRSIAMIEANVDAAQARVTAARAAVTEARSSFSRVSRELERREELFKNGLASAEETEYYRQLVDAESARVASGEANLLAAQAELESSQSQLLGTAGNDGQVIHDVTAPASGTIYRVLEESERVVTAGTPLLQISNQDNLEVVVDLLTQDAVKVEVGDAVRITGWGGDYTINAVVRYTEPEAFTKISALGVEEQRVNVIADLIDAPANLGAEYRIEVAIVIWQENEVLTIPSSAIFQRSNGWNTFVAADGETSLRSIQIGFRGRDYTQVIDGVQAGESVVLFPSDLIQNGTRISLEPR